MGEKGEVTFWSCGGVRVYTPVLEVQYPAKFYYYV